MIEIGKNAEMVTTDGHQWGSGEVVGYYDGPVYIIKMDNGEHKTWLARLTRETSTAGEPEPEKKYPIHHALDLLREDKS